MAMPPRRTRQECLKKISEMIGEAIVEDAGARRQGLLTLADMWIEVADRRKDDEAGQPTVQEMTSATSAA
jgi:hypothetical protein